MRAVQKSRGLFYTVQRKNTKRMHSAAEQIRHPKAQSSVLSLNKAADTAARVPVCRTMQKSEPECLCAVLIQTAVFGKTTGTH